MTVQPPRILPCGDRAVLLDCDSLAEATAWFEALADVDPVLGARTVLLRGDPGALRALVSSRRPSASPEGNEHETVVVPVTYDGPDLAAVARLTGLSEKDVIAAHTGTAWTVGFTGFAPGFAYLVDGDPRLQVPRLETPRPTVPAGSVGLAGAFSGIYPRASPGGWQLIGRTDIDLFDLHRTPPARLQPGMRVRFEPVPSGVAR
jgi:KipI family sensor histidine kinase inhibitor